MKLYKCRCCEQRKMRLLFNLLESGELDFVCTKCRKQESARLELYEDCKEAFTDQNYKVCSQCKGLKPTTRFNKLSRYVVDLHPANVYSHCKACAQRYTEEYQQRNSEKVKTYFSEYWQRKRRVRTAAQRKRTAQTSAAWQRANKAKVVAGAQRYRARKARAGGSFTGDEWTALCNRYDNRCLACGQQKPLAADHIIPVSKGGSSFISNIQPLCRECNSSKGTKTIDYRPSNR